MPHGYSRLAQIPEEKSVIPAKKSAGGFFSGIYSGQMS
jgi:hypothetical protein